MRKRSQTIQADSYEEYLEISIAQGPSMHDGNLIPIESPYNEPPSVIEEKKRLTLKDPGSLQIQDYKFTMVGFEDDELDLAIEQFEESKSVSTGLSSRNLSGANASFDFDLLSPCFSPSSNTKIKFEKTKVQTAMIVGLTGTGRHTFLNAAFKEPGSNEQSLRNPFDLIIKHQEQEGCLNTFKFWLQDPTNKKIDSLIKIYYKRINFYIFIYKVEDPQSFALLDKSIEQVKAEVSEERFKGILIGNIENLAERSVSFEEGLKLKHKHKLAEFVETKFSSSNVEKLLFDFLLTKEKISNFSRQ